MLTSVAGTAAGDGGTSDDAPNTQADALLVGEGTFNGSGYDRDLDWYRIVVPEGKAVHAAFSILSGDTWNDLIFYDAAGASMGYISDGGIGAYDPDDAEAWFLIESWWGPMEYTVTLSFINVPPQDDGGSGRDAGNSERHALPISPGRVRGSVERTFGDPSDWYRLSAPVGTIVDVHDATVWVEILDAEGRYLAGTPFSKVSDGTPLFFRVGYGEDYSFVVDVSLPGDLRVDSVEVREIEIVTSGGPTGVTYQREVVVTLANEGVGPSRAALLSVTTEHEGPTSRRVVGTRDLMLEPGESVTYTIPWDVTGQVGDFTVVASVANEHDADAADNRGAVATFVGAGGLGFGVDALNHDVFAAELHVGVVHGGGRTGAVTPAGFLGYDHGVIVLP